MAYEQSSRDLLYNNCYIAGMVGQDEAVQYFTRLMQCDGRDFRLSPLHAPGVIFITHPPMYHAPPSTSINGRPAWILDYGQREYGSVVLQRIYCPTNVVGTVEVLNMPIFFFNYGIQAPGYQLAEARLGNLGGLLNEHALAPVGNPRDFFIRINWPGYEEWRCRIRNKGPNTISYRTLAKEVAVAVCYFLENFAQQQIGWRPPWRIGPGNITKDDIYLIGLIHIDQGTWQPILQLNRYIL